MSFFHIDQTLAANVSLCISNSRETAESLSVETWRRLNPLPVVIKDSRSLRALIPDWKRRHIVNIMSATCLFCFERNYMVKSAIETKIELDGCR